MVTRGDQYRLAAKDARQHAKQSLEGVDAGWLKLAAHWEELAKRADKADAEAHDDQDRHLSEPHLP